jgi:manganese-dependent ADP-ribose/CDP-alcohol diphosphatase
MGKMVVRLYTVIAVSFIAFVSPVTSFTLKMATSFGESVPQDSPLSSTRTAPRFSFGVVADIQYAPIPDGHSHLGVPRYYRGALTAARTAASHFQREKLPIVLNLGDVVDGKCQEIETWGGNPTPPGIDPGHQAVDDVLEELSVYQYGRVIHAYGNHCLYNLDRHDMQRKLNIPFVTETSGELVGYSSYSHDGIRFLVIDSYDVALMRRCQESSEKYKQADEILRQNNPNYPESQNSPEGLVELERRYVAFNGAVGPTQLKWLRQELTATRQQGEKAIILSHQPILPGSCSPTCLIWNYQDVLDVLRDFSDVVMACFAGHDHTGGYQRDDQSGIHFRVFEGVLESPDPIATYAIVHVHEDGLVVCGFGECKSAEYDSLHCNANIPSNE